jgi:hypothetical protein
MSFSSRRRFFGLSFDSAFRRTLMASAVMCCCMAAVAIAQDKPANSGSDVVIFKNGDQLRGTLISSEAKSVVFKSDTAGEITISLDKIKELHAHGSFAVLKKNVPLHRQDVERLALPGTVNYSDGVLEVESPAGSSTQVPDNDLGFIVNKATFDKALRGQSFLHGWTGSVTGSATRVQATNYGTTFNAGLNLVRVAPVVTFLPPHDRQIFNLSETYGQLTQPVIPPSTPAAPNKVAKTSLFHADFEYDRYFSPRFFGLGDTSFDHSYAQGLDLQQIYGGGVGWTPIESPTQQLDLKADVHYAMQKFVETASTSSQNLIGSTFSENYRHVLPWKLLLTETGSSIPAWNNSNAYSAHGSVNLALPTIHRLTVNLGMTDSFINNPPPFYKKNSFQFITGIGYTFQ